MELLNIFFAVQVKHAEMCKIGLVFLLLTVLQKYKFKKIVFRLWDALNHFRAHDLFFYKYTVINNTVQPHFERWGLQTTYH